MYAVIMAGGVGKRFWPRSRKEKPKQFLSILDSKTMIQETVSRLYPVIPKNKIYYLLKSKYDYFGHRSWVYCGRLWGY